MSDPAIIFIAGGVQAVMLAVIAAFLKVWQDRNHVVLKDEIGGVKQDIKVVSNDVNGKMAQLLQVTGEAEKAKGVVEGHAEAKAEAKAEAESKG